MDDNATIRNLPIYKAAMNDDWDSVEHIFDAYPNKLDAKITIWWETPLHIATGTNTSHRFVNNIVEKIAFTDVQKLRAKNCWGNTALHYAAKLGNTIDAKLLVSKDPGIAQVTNTEGHTALKLAAWYGRHDTVWYLLEVTKDEPGENGIPVNLEKASDHPFRSFISKLILLISPCTKDLSNKKLMHVQTLKLVERMCSVVIEKGSHDIAWDILGTAVSTAVKYGIHELIKVCVETYPDIVWYEDDGFYLFIAAIRYRQEKVFNLVYRMTGHKVFAATVNPNADNPLHIAGRLSPLPRLKTVSGAALQMQRELQWYKQVEKLVEPIYKEALNNDHMTPRMVFTEAHKDLVDEGETWMKDTSSSSTVVGALVVTMAFAGAFTVPGGNDSNGLPYFLNDAIFIVFIVSDAIALFASTTSVLMFLAILTSRYAEEDFYYALPKRMMIALVSLFLSLAATMIAFSATLALVVRDKIPWIAAPVTVFASVPVTLFAMLQFPLLVELVYSTYGPSIFINV